MLYEVPKEFYVRLHHVRPRFKDDIENVLIYMATEIAKIPKQPKVEFDCYFDEIIRNFPGNADKVDKTIHNWRTEISALFGFYQKENDEVFAGLRARELADNNDLVAFFKTFLYNFQYPGGHLKVQAIAELINLGVKFKPAKYLLQVLKAGQKLNNNNKRVYITKAEFCHCIFNDLRCVRDNQEPQMAWERIVKNRNAGYEYDTTGDIVRYAGDIIDYLEYANMLVTYNGRDFYLNQFEEETILKFINSNEWFSGYDKYIDTGKFTNSEINKQQILWMKFVNRDMSDTDFSTNVINLISSDSVEDETEIKDDSIKSFIERLSSDKITQTKEIGDMGEAIVYSHECEKLRIAGEDEEDLTHLVKRIPTQLAVGYDIQSVDFMRHKRYIEVKTTISTKPLNFNKVHLTSNEWNTASTIKENYYIYRLMISKKENKLFILNDPVTLYKQNKIDMSLSVSPGADIMFNVTEVGGFEELLAWKEN